MFSSKPSIVKSAWSGKGVLDVIRGRNDKPVKKIKPQQNKAVGE
jgi:hypothetical protein